VKRIRTTLVGAGILLALFGVFRLVTQVNLHDLLFVLIWLIGALIIHDAILSPSILGIGRLVGHVPPRARRYLQGALITAGAVTVIALPMIYRAHSQPAVKALLEQNFAVNLLLLLGVIAAAAVLLYVSSLLRHHQTPVSHHDPPSDDA
jgi:hypothetical protein